MSRKRLGKAFIKVDGKLIETAEGAKLDPGGVERSPVVGNEVHGYSEKERPASVECEISVGPDTSITELNEITDATVVFEADTGQSWIIREAWSAEPAVVTAGEGGKVPLKFVGPPAEEMKK